MRRTLGSGLWNCWVCKREVGGMGGEDQLMELSLEAGKYLPTWYLLSTYLCSE